MKGLHVELEVAGWEGSMLSEAFNDEVTTREMKIDFSPLVFFWFQQTSQQSQGHRYGKILSSLAL